VALYLCCFKTISFGQVQETGALCPAASIMGQNLRLSYILPLIDHPPSTPQNALTSIHNLKQPDPLLQNFLLQFHRAILPILITEVFRKPVVRPFAVGRVCYVLFRHHSMRKGDCSVFWFCSSCLERWAGPPLGQEKPPAFDLGSSTLETKIQPGCLLSVVVNGMRKS